MHTVCHLVYMHGINMCTYGSVYAWLRVYVTQFCDYFTADAHKSKFPFSFPDKIRRKSPLITQQLPVMLPDLPKPFQHEDIDQHLAPNYLLVWFSIALLHRDVPGLFYYRMKKTSLLWTWCNAWCRDGVQYVFIEWLKARMRSSKHLAKYTSYYILQETSEDSFPYICVVISIGANSFFQVVLLWKLVFIHGG